MFGDTVHAAAFWQMLPRSNVVINPAAADDREVAAGMVG
jgi:hypothetical protein